MNRRGNLPNPNMQGIYANKSMCHALTALVGAKCTVRTKNEENTFEGFFHCFSPTMDIIVSAAHKVIIFNCSNYGISDFEIGMSFIISLFRLIKVAAMSP